jgi:hypothetical protein
VKAAAIYAALFAFFVGCCLLSVCGCATAELNFKRALATTATAVAGAYESFNQYDRTRVEEIRAKAHVDPAEASIERIRYDAQVRKVLIAFAVADDALKATNGASHVWAYAKIKDWAHALQELLQVGFAVADALKEFGIKVPL